MEITDISGEQPAEPQDEGSLRDDLAAAFEEHGAEVPAPEREDEEHGGEEGGGEPEAPAGERSRDDKGRFAKAGEKPSEQASPGEKPAQPAQPPKPAAAPGEAPPPKPAAPAFKPPQSWTPAAREALLKADPLIQQEVLKREREISQGLNETAPARQFREEYQQRIGPFEAMFRAEGAQPIQALESLARTAYALRTGTMDDRAGMIARMTRQFLGTDPRNVALLDAALSKIYGGGQPDGGGGHQQPVDVRTAVQQALSEVVRRHQQTRRDGLVSQQHAEIQKFAENHEFYNDVRDEFELVLAQRARKNLPFDLEATYAAACKLNPEVAKVLDAREKGKRAAEAAASAQRAQRAGSSPRPTPARQPSQQARGSEDGESDLRSDLRAAFDEASRR